MNDRDAAKWLIKVVAVVLLIIVAMIFGLIAAGNAFGRYQAIQDANNNAQVARIQANNEQYVNKLRIAAQTQKVQIAAQDAAIRKQQAIGIREAQDQISGTLTPLYVQYELTQAMKDIAESGKNNTVIYIPVGPDGLPVVAPVK